MFVNIRILKISSESDRRTRTIKRGGMKSKTLKEQNKFLEKMKNIQFKDVGGWETGNVIEACCEIIKEINKNGEKDKEEERERKGKKKKYREDLQRYLHLAICFCFCFCFCF